MDKNILKLLVVAIALGSCGGSKKDATEDQIAKTQHEEVINYVDTVLIYKRTFNKQIVCNGKLRAVAKTDLAFAQSGIIADIKVFNGSQVTKGDLMASLNTKEANIGVAIAKNQMKKADIDLIDKLIGQGYDSDTTKVPSAIMKSAKITSGYNSAIEKLEEAERKLEECFLYAPFSGRVANMNSKIHQLSADTFCTLIDDSYFDVEFSLLEAELGDVSTKQRVEVSPFIDDNKIFSGVVTEINPLIDDKGQIKIRAKVQNTGDYLIEGMNVKIIINNQIKDRYVVPKDAVVLRDGYFVVFRYIEGKAVWTYVDVEMSNIDSHVITGSEKKQTNISANDIIITSGNLNLVDGSAVKPK